MARTGSFGRRPRGGGGNLAALIASLIAQQRAAEDRAIFDAYNNGGLFQGQPVTDGRLLAYIRSRRDTFDKADPLWDQWNNSLIQQEFVIGEQKIGLAFKQGKVGAAAVARFYRDQLARIPKDSAFYREVAGRAAEWAKAAADAAKRSRGGGGGGGGGGSRKGAQAAADVAQAREVAWLRTEEAVRIALAREGVILEPGDDIFSAGADVIDRLLSTGAVVNPFTGGALTITDFNRVTTDFSKALQDMAAAYRKAGYNYDTIVKAKMAFDHEVIVQTRSLPLVSKAEAIYRTLNDALEDANGDPSLLARAYATAKAEAEALLKNADGVDATTLGMLKNDIAALSGGSPAGPGLMDAIIDTNLATGQDPLRFLQSDTQGVTSAATVGEDVKGVIDQQKLIASGKGYLVQDDNGVLAVVDKSIAPVPGQEYQQTLILQNGVPTTVFLKGTPVVAPDARDPFTGEVITDPRQLPTDGTGGKIVGYKFSYVKNGQTIEGWAVLGPGGLKFTTKDPFYNTRDNGGVILALGATFETEDPRTGKAVEIPLGDVIASLTVPSVMATATTSLVVDAAAQEFATATPDRLIQMWNNGQLSDEAVVAALDPAAPVGTPVEQAWQTNRIRAQQRDRMAQATLGLGEPSPETITFDTAKNIVKGIRDRTLPQQDQALDAPPRPALSALVDWNAALIANQQAIAKAQMTPDSPVLSRMNLAPPAPAPAPATVTTTTKAAPPAYTPPKPPPLATSTKAANILKEPTYTPGTATYPSLTTKLYAERKKGIL